MCLGPSLLGAQGLFRKALWGCPPWILHGLHAGAEVVDLGLHNLLVLQLGLDPLQVLQVLGQLSHGVCMLLAQRGGRRLALQGRLLQLPSQLQQLGLPLAVLLDLGRAEAGLTGWPPGCRHLLCGPLAFPHPTRGCPD